MAGDAPRVMIVEVGCLVDFDDLDPDDLDAEGNCAVDGAWRVSLPGPCPDPTEAALDLFHRSVPIACLEDFQITVRAETAVDRAAGEGWLRGEIDSSSPPVLPAVLGPEGP